MKCCLFERASVKLRCAAALTKQTDRATTAFRMLSTVVVVVTATSGVIQASFAVPPLIPRLRFEFATLTPLCPVPMSVALSLSLGLSNVDTKRRDLILAFLARCFNLETSAQNLPPSS